MTLWCIYRSPLIIGGNLPENRAMELSLFTNKEVLAVNQQGENPRQLYKKNGAIVWCSHIPGSTDIYAALFNSEDKAKKGTLEFKALGLKGKIVVRNLWEKQDIGVFKDLISKILIVTEQPYSGFVQPNDIQKFG
jgi:alpha-galactosidase